MKSLFLSFPWKYEQTHPCSTETAIGTWCILGGATGSHTAVFASVTKHQHLSHGSGSLRNWVDFMWESDFIVFLLLAQTLDPKADVPPRHRASGWRVQARLRLGVRVKFRGWRSDEGQGYGQGEVMVRSKYPTPLGRHLSGHCLPLCPVREMSSNYKDIVALSVWRKMKNIQLCM